jgi:hypothetical protein
MLKTVVKFLILTEAFTVVTFAGGWWGVPMVALIWGLSEGPRARPVLLASICAAAAWGSLLLLDAARGPLGEVAARFGGVMGMSPLALYAITLLLATLLSWSASVVGAEIRRAVLALRARSKSPVSEPAPAPNAPEVAVMDA